MFKLGSKLYVRLKYYKQHTYARAHEMSFMCKSIFLPKKYTLLKEFAVQFLGRTLHCTKTIFDLFYS